MGGLDGGVVVRPGDARYADLTRGANGRFASRPDEVHVVATADRVREVVAAAVRDGQRLAVRSGGHCFEGLVDHPDVRVIVDVSGLRQVRYDPARYAFAVDAGASLGHAYRSLFLGWGVTVPGGLCPQIGVGGHVAGGGYGPLCRMHGLTVDHLHAVEVVVVDGSGDTRTVVATRDMSDPNHDLWWAHTGGGGGNFGVITRYWFRSPDAVGTDPTRQLPRPPTTVLTSQVHWSWDQLGERAFARLLRNHGDWHAAHSGPDTPHRSLFSLLHLGHRAAGQLWLEVQLDGAIPDAKRVLDDYVGALCAGVGAYPFSQPAERPWLSHALADAYHTGVYDRSKSKGAYLRRPFSDRQIAVIHSYLTDPAYAGNGELYLASTGGQVNAVEPAATAVPQRDSILRAWFSSFWADPAADEPNLAWVREFYRDVFADTGGVPVPDGDADGSFVNYPDVDLADPRWNASAAAWHTLYYKDAYPRLQRVKAHWDPRDVFRHELSIRPPAHGGFR